MNYICVVVFSIYLISIKTENITLNPGEEKLRSILSGDTLTLQCPVNSSKKTVVRWSYMYKTENDENILSIGDRINTNVTSFRFRVAFTNHLKHVTFLRIYNITLKEQTMYKCYYSIEGGKNMTFEYKYNISLANVTHSMVKKPNGTVCCVLHGQSISTTNFIWEQRTLYDEHIRFFESVKQINSGTSERKANGTMRKHNNFVSCHNLSTNGILKYVKEGEYICIAQFHIYGRNQTVNKTASIKIENIQDGPFCIKDAKSRLSVIGTNVRIVMNFYSKPNYSALSFKKNDSELKVPDMFTVSMKNISLNVYNVTVLVSGYEIKINITEFSEEDVGNYTVSITNGFGSCDCTVQLLFKGNNHTEKVVIGDTKRADITRSLQWYILACGSIIVVLFAMSALRSSFLKTVDACSKPTIRKPSCHKSTEKKTTKKQAAKKPRRAYSDQFMEVTLNQRNNGERILTIGQTNEMDASTETNI